MRAEQAHTDLPVDELPQAMKHRQAVSTAGVSNLSVLERRRYESDDQWPSFGSDSRLA